MKKEANQKKRGCGIPYIYLKIQFLRMSPGFDILKKAATISEAEMCICLVNTQTPAR